MKKFILGIIILTSFFNCSQPENAIEPVQLDEFKVESQHFDSFLDDYKIFIEALNNINKDQIQSFLQTFEHQKQNGNGRSMDVTCNCQSGESSCSASTAISSCCTCWNPSTHEGACGTYWGIASCRTQSKDEPESLGRKPSELGHLVNVNATNFRNLLKFAKAKGIGIESISASLAKLESHAIL